jgi:hypothetical protein
MCHTKSGRGGGGGFGQDPNRRTEKMSDKSYHDLCFPSVCESFCGVIRHARVRGKRDMRNGYKIFVRGTDGRLTHRWG